MDCDPPPVDPCPACEGIAAVRLVYNDDAIPYGWGRVRRTTPRRWWRPWKTTNVWLMCMDCTATGVTTHHRRVGRALDHLAPHSGRCARCETPWVFVDEHITWIDDRGFSILCEPCWADTDTDERLAIYEARWATRPDADTDQLANVGWDTVALAVQLEELDPQPERPTL